MSKKNNDKDTPYILSNRLQGDTISHTGEVIITKTRTVSCDGTNNNSNDDLGHPKVYLEIAPQETTIICPYCSQEFRLDE